MPVTDARAAYARAGVDVAAGRAGGGPDAGRGRVDAPARGAGRARRVRVRAFTIPAGYREPVIVSSTDGVGTKTAIAVAMGRLDTIGIDLVAMCADDVVCTGAEPRGVPRLRRGRAAGPGAGRDAGRRDRRRAAGRPARRWWAARPPSTRA